MNTLTGFDNQFTEVLETTEESLLCYIMVFILYSVKIASFPEYTGYLINHLLQYKLFHWDRYNSHTHQWPCPTHACYSTIRELSSQSLHRLVAVAPDLMKDTGTMFVNSQTVKKGVIFEHSEMTRAQPEY